MEVAGVDGCTKGRWIVVLVGANSGLQVRSLSVEDSIQGILRRTHDCEAVGIDIPIGLTDGPPRPPDIEARRVLGKDRASSVFPAPVWQMLGARSYEEACAISMDVRGHKLSRQAYFGLLHRGRLKDVNQTMARDPALQEWIVEVHPEVSFWAMNRKRPMDYSKKKGTGRQERLALLREWYTDKDLANRHLPSDARRDDFFDACAAAWTARRFALGEAGRLPPDPPRDARGLRMEIVY